MLKKIKGGIVSFLLIIFKYHLKTLYFFFKLFSKKNNDVFLLSRQYDSLSLDYKLLVDEFEKNSIKYKVICKTIPGGLNSALRNEGKKVNIGVEIGKIFSYYFNLYKQMYYSAKSKFIIVDGYNLTTSLLKHKEGTKVMQIWHSLGAIKKFGYQAIGKKVGQNPKTAKILCMHKNYDYVIAGTKAMAKFYAEAYNVTDDKLVYSAPPSADLLLRKNEDVVRQIHEKYPQMNGKINVLYAPTFRGDGSDNIKEVISAFDIPSVNLFLSLHPKDMAKGNSEKAICFNRKEFSTDDIIRSVDYVITDYSALAVDATVLDTKLIMYVYDYDKYSEENGINIDPFTELPGNSYTDIKDVVKAVTTDNYNSDSFNQFKEKYASFEDNNTKTIVDIIKRNI